MTQNLASVPNTLNDLQILAAKAASNRKGNLSYSGEVLPVEAFEYTSKHKAIIVDVRTIPEWQFVGTPDLRNTPSKLLTLSWKLYPSFATNPDFIDSLAKEEGVTKDTALFFLCRSGGRSLDAAVAATQAGYHYCFNITGGFEGDVDSNGHRRGQGWKHDNLPWLQG